MPLAFVAITAVGCTGDPAPKFKASAAIKEFRECADCPPMIAVPAGSFIMGSPDSEEGRSKDEGPQRRVRIAALAIAKHETTFAEWDACVADGGCGGRRPDDQDRGRGNMPVFNVSWFDARAYAAWLTHKTGKAYRLLSEAEWEYGARAGASTQYSWGQIASHEYANYGQDICCDGHVSGRDQWLTNSPMESFPANAFGLHDMLGNVWEWVEDCWEESHERAPADGSARATGDCNRHILRGGSWASLPVRIRAAFRDAHPSNDRQSTMGFRVARSN